MPEQRWALAFVTEGDGAWVVVGPACEIVFTAPTLDRAVAWLHGQRVREVQVDLWTLARLAQTPHLPPAPMPSPRRRPGP